MDTMKTYENALATLVPAGWHVCTCCRRLLPPDAFYLRRRDGSPEGRCKECHRQAMRLRRRMRALADTQFLHDVPTVPRITNLPDRDERLRLIREALRHVRESMERRRRKLRAEDFFRETGLGEGFLYDEQ